jgi:hypothetical protein
MLLSCWITFNWPVVPPLKLLENCSCQVRNLIADHPELGIYWPPHTKLREVTDMFSIRHSVAVGVFIACFSGLVLAQGGATGAITGTVQDPLGAVLSGAKVDIVSEATGQTERHLTTDSSGNFNATLLPVGSYTVQVSAPDLPPRSSPASWSTLLRPRALRQS